MGKASARRRPDDQRWKESELDGLVFRIGRGHIPNQTEP